MPHVRHHQRLTTVQRAAIILVLVFAAIVIGLGLLLPPDVIRN